MTALRVEPHANGFGARLTGVDLTQPLGDDVVAAIRTAWLKHQVVYFPEQPMNHDDLERVTRYIGPFGHDPYVAPMATHPHILEVRRDAKEVASPFGGGWHSDWSFQDAPPAATLLHAKVVPPVGGETWFADGYAAFAALPDETRDRITDLQGIHSARHPYSPTGFFARDKNVRAMQILSRDDAYDTRHHPLVCRHPETHRDTLFINRVYTIGVEGLDDHAARQLLASLCEHATRDEFVYRHQWQPNMLILWDNRCVQHAAQGGYDGHLRLMHRTTVAGSAPRAA